MPVTKDQILDRLRTVQDPELHRDIVTLNQVRGVAYCDGVASVTLRLTQPAPGAAGKVRKAVEEAVRSLGDEVKRVVVDFELAGDRGDAGAAAGGGASGGAGASASGGGGASASGGQQAPQDAARASNPLPNVKHVIAVGAGKGGVGKSTVAVNLGVALARQGAKVGVMDGDIYGPSLPTMLGLEGIAPQTRGNMIVPFEVHGIKAMTIGALVEEDKPLIWRGPMAHGAFRQLATQTDWGELDYLVIDLPPGTGDVPLTLAQLLPLSGAIIVCTPQKVAQDDARRAVRMFQQLGIEVLGLVENMSYFIGDDGKEYDIFGRGGAEMMAQHLGVPCVGTVPINTALRRNCDAGDPTANFTGDDQLAAELDALARRVAQQVQLQAMQQQRPTISVH